MSSYKDRKEEQAKPPSSVYQKRQSVQHKSKAFTKVEVKPPIKKTEAEKQAGWIGFKTLIEALRTKHPEWSEDRAKATAANIGRAKWGAVRFNAAARAGSPIKNHKPR